MGQVAITVCQVAIPVGRYLLRALALGNQEKAKAVWKHSLDVVSSELLESVPDCLSSVPESK